MTSLSRIGLVLAAIYLILFGGTWVGIYLPTLRLFTIGLAAAVLGGWLVVARRGPDWRPRSVLALPIGLAIAAIALSTAFSRTQRVSLEYLAYSIVLGALYLLLVRVMAVNRLRQRLIAVSTVLFFALSAVFVVLGAEAWLRWWGAVGQIVPPPLRPASEGLTFGNPSAVLTASALLAVPTVAVRPWSTGRGLGVLLAAVALVGIVALLSGSRGGWFGLAVAGVAAGYLALRSREAVAAVRRSTEHLGRRTRIRMAVGAVIIVLVLAASALAPGILQRVTGGGEDLRASYVAVALRLFAEAPLTGTGPGSWVVQRIGYTQAGEADGYAPHAHDVYIQALAELGLVGILAGLIVAIALARLLGRALGDQHAERRRWAIAAAVGLAYFAAHQVIDFYANMPAILFLAAIPVAYVDATDPRHDHARPKSVGSPSDHRLARAATRTAFPAAALLLAVALGGLGLQELPALTSSRAVELANANHWAEADPLAQAAADQDPDIGSYRFTAALTAAHVGDWTRAADHLAAIARRDDLPEAWLNYAAASAVLGDRVAAGEAIGHALRLGRQRAAMAVPAGELARQLGDEATAIDAFAAGLALAPSLAADPWWSSDPDRQRLLRAVVEAAWGRMAPAARWELALMAGDPARARAATTDERHRLFIDGWGGDATAAAVLLDRCRSEPQDIGLVQLCARLQARAGNADDASRLRLIAAIQNAGGEGAAELRVVDPTNPGPRAPGGLASYWGPYTYRRFTPWEMLVPSLVHLGSR